MARSGARMVAPAGVAAQVIFTGYWLLAPLWQGPRYSVAAHSISDMYAVTAPLGAIMVTVVTLCGAATLAAVVLTILPAVRATGWTGRLGAALLGLSIFGLGDLLTPAERLACRLADPGCAPDTQLANAGGRLDATLSTIGIVLLIAAGFVLATSTRRLPGWRTASVALYALSSLLLAVLVLAGVLPSTVSGLVERALALVGATLVTVLILTAERHRGVPVATAAPD